MTTTAQRRQIITRIGDRAIDLKRRFPGLLGPLSDDERNRWDHLQGAREVSGGVQLALDFNQPTKET